MIKVSLVGTGAVSTQLLRVFEKTKLIKVVEVLASRGNFNEAIANDKPEIYIIAVSDDAISEVAKKLKDTNKLVVHTSGSVHLDALPHEVRGGVFYPLQTFSKEREVNFEQIPICIEAKQERDEVLLKKLGSLISKQVFEITSEQRKTIHLAAVFVNNFSNHMFQLASEICSENEVSFDLLKPLIEETVAKLQYLSPLNAQTGPAKRNDQQTIERHLNQLDNKTHKMVYEVLTNSIKETYGKKL